MRGRFAAWEQQGAFCADLGDRQHLVSTGAGSSGELPRRGTDSRRAEIQQALQEVDARAANVCTGYVYVVSNIGAFGDSIVKIGMTRRLEPLDRVYELSGAAVPFRFDVHALIFSKDAVGLETRLHQEFARPAASTASTAEGNSSTSPPPRYAPRWNASRANTLWSSPKPRKHSNGAPARRTDSGRGLDAVVR
ncbi:GIY-YIG nuclease family protein [Streptomyces sp. NPDC058486]|uniref:GIY-YIG nuclease family protein n=1 Tax=unclassified Streptomyces TaxID=2593676 RepID=UPI00365FCAC2